MTRSAAARLNDACFCVPVNLDAVWGGLAEALSAADHGAALSESHEGYFAGHAVFVAREDVAAMQAVVDAVEQVVKLPGYQAAALADAPDIAARLPAAAPVLNGYDFHLGPQGPRLIEVNTNAGGIMLAAALADGLPENCPPSEALGPVSRGIVDKRLWDMFADAWRRSRGARPLRRIAIVDAAPREQYLYPEFALFQSLFRRFGVAAVIAAPEELDFADGVLGYHGDPVDLVYNRLTDFYLQAASVEALREAALADAVVLTPDPRAHALYANKRNLARLTDRAALAAWGAADSVIETLEGGIPATRIVRPDEAEILWAARKGLFFKPAGGYGSRGSYRGDKLTRGRFREILEEDYVAQALMAPGARAADLADPARTFKFDVRSYVYGGRSLLLAARLYQGQTTNFRTAGGGFAPVLEPPENGWQCPDPLTSATSAVISSARMAAPVPSPPRGSMPRT